MLLSRLDSVRISSQVKKIQPQSPIASWAQSSCEKKCVPSFALIFSFPAFHTGGRSSWSQVEGLHVDHHSGFQCLWKGEWLVLIFFIVFPTFNFRNQKGEDRVLWRCQNKCLAHCVPGRLPADKLFFTTRRSTLEFSCTIAYIVTSRSVWMAFWGGTPSFTAERNRTSAQSATFQATQLPASMCIWKSTLGGNFTTAINATFHATMLVGSFCI